MELDIFPFAGKEADYTTPTSRELPLFREFAYDFKNDTYIIENNEFKVLEGNKALEVWIYFAIKTTRYAYLIYSDDFGTELDDLVGQKFTKGLTESEAFRYVKEAILINPYILEVENNGVEFNDGILNINIKVTTIYGEMGVKI